MSDTNSLPTPVVSERMAAFHEAATALTENDWPFVAVFPKSALRLLLESCHAPQQPQTAEMPESVAKLVAECRELPAISRHGIYADALWLASALTEAQQERDIARQLMYDAQNECRHHECDAEEAKKALATLQGASAQQQEELRDTKLALDNWQIDHARLVAERQGVKLRPLTRGELGSLFLGPGNHVSTPEGIREACERVVKALMKESPSPSA